MPRPGTRTRAPAILPLAGACLLGLAGCGPTEPPNARAGRAVFDEGELLAAKSAARIERQLDALREDRVVDLVVYTLPDLDGFSIDELANARFEEWEVGRELGGRGILLVVARAERQVRVEVGYALEDRLPDALVSYLERDQMEPWFADGRIGPGVEATVELLVGRLISGGEEDVVEVPEPAAGRLSGGAGVQAEVRFEGGTEREPLEEESVDRFAAQPTPEHAWMAFLEVNRLRIKDPELGLYDDGARRRMRGTVTDAGQDHIVRLYEGEVPVVRTSADRAVILFPEDPDHVLAPWFFRRGPGGWQLDGAAIFEIIGYNHRNQWRFRRRDHPYMFAFRNVRFDEHGFAFFER